MLPENNGGFVTLHFVHGRTPKFESGQYIPFIKDTLTQAKANTLGGRVLMHIDRHMYGFRIQDNHRWMHIIPNSFPSRIQCPLCVKCLLSKGFSESSHSLGEIQQL